MQNRRDIAALTDLVEQMAARLTAAHERLVQTVTSLIQEDRARLAVLLEAQQRTDASIAALTDGLGELRAQINSLTEAQQRTDASIAALAEAQQRTDASVAALTDGLGELRAQINSLTEAQQRTDASIAALAEAQQRTDASVAALTDGLGELRAQINSLTEAQQRTDASIAALTEAQQRTDASIAALTEAQQRTGASITSLTEAQQRTDASIAALTEAQQRTNERLVAMDQKIDTGLGRLSGRISNLAGGRYEKRAVRILRRRARNRFGLVSTSISHVAWESGGPLSDIADSDKITDEEFYDLERIDMVITGPDKSGETIHVTGEISITVELDDVVRAAGRADVLRRATGQTVHAAAIGESATADAMDTAENLKVAILITPPLADED